MFELSNGVMAEWCDEGGRRKGNIEFENTHQMYRGNRLVVSENYMHMMKLRFIFVTVSVVCLHGEFMKL
jgi:hypothetical protein